MVAGPPSPMLAGAPPPANLLMTPVAAVILRTRLLNLSATYTLPELSTATPAGWARPALVAGPPSPVDLTLRLPVPATVVMIPCAWISPAAASSEDTATGRVLNMDIAIHYTISRASGDPAVQRRFRKSSVVRVGTTLRAT